LPNEEYKLNFGILSIIFIFRYEYTCFRLTVVLTTELHK